MPSDISPVVPENAIINATICVVSWLNGETGKMHYAVKTTGGTPISTLLGLLELAKFDLLHDD